MKATIETDGTLTIMPESTLEAYALEKWQADYAAGKVKFAIGERKEPKKKPRSVNSPNRPAATRPTESFAQAADRILKNKASAKK